MNKHIIVGIIAGVIVCGGIGAYLLSQGDEDAPATKTTTSTHGGFEHDAEGHHLNHSAEDMVEALDSAPTREQVAKHASKDDCWTIIDSSVYNLTSFIQEHPGGDNILSACGTDATAYCKGEKAGQEGDTKDHSGSSEAYEHLGSLKLGELAQE